ncbi:hypothetical protein Vau01_099010 [Virgisporangium aurantiacum]|uniref:Uncharacterized protein n=1 Tax=Virgisporangium aurantiacum TaxID=175570 RepID=A0A8J3ZI85_9ACTN|nr:hypothetical protein Vau01_099010 [Virgisporangium aurantiacum]
MERNAVRPGGRAHRLPVSAQLTGGAVTRLTRRVPIEETLGASDELASACKIRYSGLSTTPAPPAANAFAMRAGDRSA